MRRGNLIALVLAPLLVLPAAAQAGIPVDVTGNVGERSGLFPGSPAPLGGATVQLLDESQADALVDSDTTNGSGNYGLTVPVGTFKIVASKTGYVTQCRRVQGQGAGFTPPPIELPTPTQAGTLNGVVTDSFTGNGIQGVSVDVGYASGCASATPPALTDSSGHYVFPNGVLPGPVHTVRFTASGYPTRTETTTVYGGGTNLNVELDPPDITAPKTKILSLTVNGHRMTARFKANDPEPSSGGINFSCEIDNLGGDEYDSPATFRQLSKGHHRFTVTAFDAEGNFDQTPAKQGFRIK